MANWSYNAVHMTSAYLHSKLHSKSINTRINIPVQNDSQFQVSVSSEKTKVAKTK